MTAISSASQNQKLHLQQAPDFRELLQAELVRRTKQNPAYSLRAFARMLGVQSGFLSKILLGQRRVTATTVRRFGAKLGLSLRDIEHYENITQQNKEESPTLNFRQISYDQFQVLADWYHFAILELAIIKDFQPQPKWIARTLGISLATAREAIERLERLHYIEIQPNGSWILREEHSTTLGMAETNAALRQMQRQFLQKALDALENVDIHERDQSAVTMAIDSSRLPEAKEKIKKFRRELASFVSNGKIKDSVYQMSISLYPLMQKEK